jgi:hypothetical protein
MGVMEFSWRMTTALVWPVVLLVGLVLYRNWITATIASLAEKIKSVKAGPSGIEVQLWETKSDAAGHKLAGALKQGRSLVGSEPIPTSLVDLIDDVNKNPQEGIRAAFRLVRKILNDFYPQLASVAPRDLPAVMKHLARDGTLSSDVEWAVTYLYELLEMSDSDVDAIGRGHGYEFLMLAEGAIHGILRTASPLLHASWAGIYNDDYPMELHVEKWQNSRFEGVMKYPEWNTETNVVGSVANKAGDDGSIIVAWRETGYRSGTHSIGFKGRYEAIAAGNLMSGGWYSGDALIARFKMEHSTTA